MRPAGIYVGKVFGIFVLTPNQAPPFEILIVELKSLASSCLSKTRSSNWRYR